MGGNQSLYPWETPGWKKAFGGGKPSKVSQRGYFDKMQNAFLQSGVNTGKTGFHSGLVSYEPNVAPATNLNVAAPKVTIPARTQSAVAAAVAEPTTVAYPTIVGSDAPVAPKSKVAKTSSNKNGGLKAPPPLVAPKSVAAAAPVATTPVADGVGFEAAMGIPGSIPAAQVAPEVGLDPTSYAGSLSRLAGYNGNGSVIQGSSGAPGAAWYSSNPGGYTDEQLANMSEQDRIKVGALSSNLTNTLNNVSAGVGTLSGLYNMYSMYQNNRLQKDQYNYARNTQNNAIAASEANRSEVARVFGSNYTKQGIA